MTRNIDEQKPKEEYFVDMEEFNDLINKNSLTELPLIGKRYTWSNARVSPLMTLLDRFFISEDWEDSFPLSKVVELVNILYNHRPVILNTNDKLPTNGPFKFEEMWLKEENFENLVITKWNSLNNRIRNNIAKNLLFKLGELRSHLKN